MKITIIGASAGVGLRTAIRTLEAGHNVSTLSRTMPALPTTPALRPILGSALNPDDVANAVSDADAILVTLGTGRSRKPTTLFSEASRVLVATVTKLGISAPVLVLTGFGAGDSDGYQKPVLRIGMKILLGKIYQDKTRMEQELSASPLNWEIVRPARLTNGPCASTYRAITDYTASMKITSVSRDDVADYLVTEAEKPLNLHRYVALTT